MIKNNVCLSKIPVYLLPSFIHLKTIHNQTELQTFKNSLNLSVSYKFNTKLEKENTNKELDIRDLKYSYKLKDKYRYFILLRKINTGLSELSINNSKLFQNITRSYRMSMISAMTNRYKLPLEGINTLPDTGIRIFQKCVYFFKIFYAKIAYNVKVSKKYTIPNRITIFTNRYYNKTTDNKLKNTRFFNIQKLAKLFTHTTIQHNTFW
ncbi:Map1-related protein [Ehrlichia ruminantium]|uniref:Map1-related protein n=1 Tax=Ehrlichia ruminantium TaxID=779 RepID=A0A161M4M4_EHRRU|nr:P44/Msp2 family outer membrane protein [Ehrlichia ruminantium]BBE10866.1 map1-5 [uncultured Ehrlichia sp.]BBG58272.1 map1-5 [uncultured Ehrlichia sp.]GAT75809.1 Map1-related protein [Ehrlichia ruminantium]GAT77776.1 Map1-related protein [Ehrlichia ruminantium]